jgi:hypothetical protein
MNARAWLVRLYPRDWRERYGEEFDALLEQCLHSPLDVLDVALGALDAHLGSFYEGNWRLFTMVNKLRTSILIVFTAYIVFVIAGFSLLGLVDDSPAAALMKTHTTALSPIWNTIAAGSVVALLAVVAGGLPLAITLARQAFTSSHRTLRLLLVPVFAFLALVLYVLFMASVNLGWIHLNGVAQVVSPDNFPLGNKLMLGGAMLVFILGAIASVAAVWKAVTGLEGTESQPGNRFNTPRTYQYAFGLAGLAALAMLVMLVGTLVFGWLANSALPDWFPSNLGLLLSKTGASYAVTVTLMVLATGLALFGWLRGLSARKTA